MKKIDLIICQGLPGSGKSTWSRKFVNELPHNRVRVCRDEIRHQLGPYWIPTKEKLVTDVEKAIVKAGLSRGYTVVVDSTNLRGIDRFKTLLREFSDDFPFEITLSTKSFLDVSVEECILRDSLRDEAQRVDEKVIRDMYNSKTI